MFKKLAEDTFNPEMEIDDDLIAALNNKQNQQQITNFNKLKHIFEIKIIELKNVPILSKILRDLERTEKDMTGKRMSGKYIQTVFVKYTFPVDDEPLESDYLTYPDESSD